MLMKRKGVIEEPAKRKDRRKYAFHYRASRTCWAGADLRILGDLRSLSDRSMEPQTSHRGWLIHRCLWMRLGRECGSESVRKNAWGAAWAQSTLRGEVT